MNIIGVIPARYASSRFPGKPLAMIKGKSMINRVWEQAKKAATLKQVIVATDDARIFDHVKAFGGKAFMTSVHHPNGTSRCNEVLDMIGVISPSGEIDAVINIQGDEPYINPKQINQVAKLFENPDVEIATLARKVTDAQEVFNPNVVKVISNLDGDALYFSRQTIPYLRDFDQEVWLDKHDFYKHIGIYGYRPKVLKAISKLQPGRLEEAEQLEQLRWLENGFTIKVGHTEFESQAVDTPEDLSKLTNNT